MEKIPNVDSKKKKLLTNAQKCWFYRKSVAEKMVVIIQLVAKDWKGERMDCWNESNRMEVLSEDETKETYTSFLGNEEAG